MVRSAALVLTLVTGFSALVYEIAWQKYLAVLLGSHAEATAVVLGLFLGGLSYGYKLFGGVSRRLVERAPAEDASPRLLRVYGAIEAAIGGYILLFPLLFLGVRTISVALPHTGEWIAFPIDVLLAGVLILPPTILMGGTIPFLTQALSTSLADATRFHAFVYGFNTVGAFVGAIAAGFVLIPALGLSGVMLAMGTVNLAAGAAFFVLSRLHRGPTVADETRPAQAADSSALDRSTVLGYIVVAALAGFAMMALQTVVNRVAALAVGGSPFTFSIVVAVFVFGIAVGSLAVSTLRRISPAVLPLTQWVLVAYLLLLYPRIPDAPYWAHAIRASFRDLPVLAYAYHVTNYVALQIVLLVPLALSGATLPLLFHRLRSEVSDLGRIAGRLYSWNTVGSLLGALLGGYALLFWLDLHHVYRLAVLALACGAAIVSVRALPRGRVLGGVGVIAAVLIVALAPRWAPERMSSGTFRMRSPMSTTYSGPETFFTEPGSSVASPEWVRFYEDGPMATVAVFDSRGTRGLLINGKSDGAIPQDHLTFGLFGLLPALLAERCERAFVIGYGTGLTVGEVASIDSVREVVVAEFSPSVMRAAPEFDELNRNTSKNPKLSFVRSDAYRALLREPEKFDIIISNPTNPWVAGIEMLYSLDFLEAARSRLAPGGVFAHWIHTYETDRATVELVLSTYRQAFDNISVWYGDGRDLVILGFEGDSPQRSITALEARWSQQDYRTAFQRVGVSSFPGLLAHELLPLGVLHEIRLPDTVHTLMHPTLNHRATLAFFAGALADLPLSNTRRAAEVGARNSLLAQYHTRLGGSMPDSDWQAAVDEACLLSLSPCATFLARWQLERPASPVFAETLARVRRETGTPPALSAGNLGRLTSLFQADGTVGANPTYDVARHVSTAFDTYYHHAFPFHASALRGAWQRCAGDTRCDEGRAKALETGVDPDRTRP